MAALHGVTAAPPERCRLLEVACSEGANLIPMAYALPESEFTGFDLAGLPVARGQQRCRELGLKNIRLFEADLCDVAGLEEYNYIVAHGVYAWVPHAVRERLLALCREHLAPGGVAFISYNALPGSHLRGYLRDALRWAGKSGGTPDEQVAAGVALLQMAAQAQPVEDHRRRLVEEQLARLNRRPAAAIYHDELCQDYEPVSIVELVEAARRHGLEFLSEAELPMPSDPGLRPERLQAVARFTGGDRIAEEYALDFLRMRLFRETLLVRSGAAIVKDASTEAIPRMRFTSAVTVAAGGQPGTETYQLENGGSVSCNQPPVIALVDQLIGVWPKTLGYREVAQTLEENGLLQEQVPGLLLQMAIARLIGLHVWEAPAAGRVSERPRASAAARRQMAAEGRAANLWHGTVAFDDPQVRALLVLLDGTRTRAELLAELRPQFPGADCEALEQGIESNLQRFCRAALLEA